MMPEPRKTSAKRGRQQPLTTPVMISILEFSERDNLVIQPAEKGKLEVSYRWFRSHKQAEAFCMELSLRSSYALG